MRINPHVFFDDSQKILSGKALFLLTLMAFFFSVAVRLLMLSYLLPDGEMWYADGTPVCVLSPDTGLYGYYAEQILSGHFYGISEPDKLPGYLIALFTFLLPLNIDWIIFLLPVFIASLIVIPVILISNALKQPLMGVAAALFLGADMYYFGRTYLSYLDTDMLNLTLPLTVILSMILVTLRRKLHYALIGGIALWFFRLWYHSSAPISALLLVGFLVSTLLLYRDRRSNFQAFIIFAAALLPIHPWLSMTAVAAVFFFFKVLNRTVNSGTKPYLAIIAILVLATPFLDYSRFYKRAEAYFDRPEMLALHGKEQDYHFLNQMVTVAEAGQVNPIKPSGYYNRQSSLMILGSLGFLLMLIRFPSMLFLAPLFVLGYASSLLGNRFLMYLAPATSFGLAFLLFTVFGTWKRYSNFSLPFATLRNLSVLFILVFLVDIIYTYSKFYSNIFNADETVALRTFSKQLSMDDTIITWWDYGWPLWFYTGHANTLTDNGEHGGPDSYIASRVLLDSSQTFCANAAIYFSAKQKEAKAHGDAYALSYLAKNGADINATLHSLKEANTTLPAYGDVYILLHSSMYSKLYSISRSSNFDIVSGKKYGLKTIQLDTLEKPFDANASEQNGSLFTLFTVNGTVLAGNNSFAIQRLMESRDHKLHLSMAFDNNSPLSAVVAKENYIFYLDNSLFDSFFVQAYFFDNYDRTRFEKVAETPLMKIFKVLPPRR